MFNKEPERRTILSTYLLFLFYSFEAGIGFHDFIWNDSLSLSESLLFLALY